MFSERPFESHFPRKQKYLQTPMGFGDIGARDGTRTHTAKPHAPQTCLSTIPTLSQVLEYYNRSGYFCQYLFVNPLPRRKAFDTL